MQLNTQNQYVINKVENKVFKEHDQQQEHAAINTFCHSQSIVLDLNLDIRKCPPQKEVAAVVVVFVPTLEQRGAEAWPQHGVWSTESNLHSVVQCSTCLVVFSMVILVEVGED